MRTRLPPLKSLEGFDAAARLGSFAAAAEELGLSHSAISHQIRSLEEALDQPLFRRIYRQVVLTDAGRDFHRTVRHILGSLRDGIVRLAPYRKPNSVILYCDHSFAECWLSPRLPLLVETLPQVDMWIDCRGVSVDLDRTEVDILIALQEPGNEEDTDGEEPPLLLSLDFQPYAHPDLASLLGGDITPAKLERCRLLHLEGKVSWAAWFGMAGETLPGAERMEAGPTFTEMRTLLVAASQGLGIGLAPTLFAAPFVAAGTLAPVGTRIWPAARSYRITAHHEPQDDPYVLPVYDWLVTQARAHGVRS